MAQIQDQHEDDALYSDEDFSATADLSKFTAKLRLDDGYERHTDKADRATTDQVFDQRTLIILHNTTQRGFITTLHGAISTGKEANVYDAIYDPEGHGDPAAEHRAVKVYKTTIMGFKDRERYITGEHRFEKGYNKGNNLKMVRLWAEKEYRNLKRLDEAGINCPKPFHLNSHVLVMSLLGDKRGRAYPKLRDAEIAGDEVELQWQRLYAQLLSKMRRLYQSCHLVHADLSEYNILYHDNTLYIIDVSQSVEPSHPRAAEFLRMDIMNVGNFFRRKGVDILPHNAVLKFIVEPHDLNKENSKDFVDKWEDILSKQVLQMMTDRRDSRQDTNIHDPVQDAMAKAQDDTEFDNFVFRNMYIPQTLAQVSDFELDGQRILNGEGSDLTYRDLLADNVINPKKEEVGSASASSDEQDGGASLDEDSEGDSGADEQEFPKPTPRGRKFQDKEEKRQHKMAVKEAKQEKRKTKMPKHIKKKLVSETSKRKK